jgi:hypothetical protein
MRILWSALVVILFPLHCHAGEAVRVEDIQIVDIGIYDAEVKTRVEDPSLVSGGRRLVSNIKFVGKTDRVPGRLGVQFGYRYKIIGEPAGATVPLKFVLRYPEPGLKNPKNGATRLVDEFTQDRTIGDIHARGYGFDSAWEIVSGVWTFEVWYQDRMLKDQKFTVVKAR